MATVPSQRTWATSDVVTATMMNANVRDAVNFFLTGRPKALVRQTVAQSLTTGTYTALTFDAEDHDNDAGHSTSTNTSRYTAVTAGWYRVSGVAAFVSNATANRFCRWAVNGTAVAASLSAGPASSGASSTHLPAVGRLVFLSAGDYVELFARQDSGGSLNTAVSADAASSMSLTWEGN